ncbi:MAG: DUF5317 family protein [Candidatus Limnocylindria bacterium]
MFILYAVPIGVLLGLVLGGRPSGLATLEFRWPLLAVAGLLVQLALFLGPVTEVIGQAGPAIYVASSAAVLVALLRNLHIPGLLVVAAGAVANLAAIVANGGYMPASPSALAALGKWVGSSYSNSTVRADPALEPLTDVFAMPAGVPFANVFSIGDVLIGAGIALAIGLAMRRGTVAQRAWPGSSLAGSKGP